MVISSAVEVAIAVKGLSCLPMRMASPFRLRNPQLFSLGEKLPSH
jgi:hypothetical protein